MGGNAESLARLKLALELSHSGAWDADLGDRRIHPTPQTHQIFGYGDAAIAWSCEAFLDHVLPADRPGVSAQLRAAMAADSDIDFECRIRRRDDQVRWIWVAGRHQRDAEGRPGRIVGIVQDITDWKQADHELKLLNETLEQRIAERTSEARWRASQLQKLAAQITQVEQRERRRLSSLLHDRLQQLLVAALLRLGAVRHTVEDAKAIESLNVVRELLDQALDETRSLASELSPPVLYELGLAAGLNWLARDARQKYELPVDVEVADEAEPRDAASKALLFQALQELILNAVKHAQASRLKLALTSYGDDQLRVTVQDDGRGFDVAQTGSTQQGTGIGLFSIRERLDVMGGQLEIVSRPGAGTMASLVIPSRRRPDAEMRGEAASARQPGSPASLADRLRVLVVDDHPVLRKGIAEVLMEHPDLDLVGQACNGQEAIEKAIELKPDVILMDVTMPVMDGIEATRRIKRFAPATRIIGLSMHDFAEVALQMQDAGASCFLAKTVSDEELIAAILRTDHPQP